MVAGSLSQPNVDFTTQCSSHHVTWPRGYCIGFLLKEERYVIELETDNLTTFIHFLSKKAPVIFFLINITTQPSLTTNTETSVGGKGHPTLFFTENFNLV
jgi:hypothetical protein